MDDADVDDLIIQALALRSAGMPDKAIEKCLAAIELSNAREDAVLLGRDLIEAQEDAKSVVEFLLPYSERKPYNPAVLSALGAAQKTVGRIEDAIETFNRALAIDPEHLEAVLRLTYVLLDLGRQKETATIFEAAARNLSVARFFNNRAAIAFAEFGYTELAEDFLRRSEALGPVDDEQRHIAAAVRGDPAQRRAEPGYVRAEFDKHAESFDRDLLSLEYAGPTMVAEALDRLGLNEPLDILDVGCGTGLVGPVLAPLAKKLVGIDLSDAMLRLAEDCGCYDTLKIADAVDVGGL